jgi:MFS family permease
LFLTAAGMGLLSLLAAFAATFGQPHIRPRRVPPVWQVLKRYQPGAILFAAVAMGVGVGMPHTFLRTYADDLNLQKIGAFFSIYALVALVARLATTRVPAKFGVRPMIVVGLSFLALSMLLYLPVRETWQFVFPAMAAGIAHALLFPAIVGGGSTAFPARYRGVGTTLMMGAFDMGVFLGAPAIGGLIHLAKDWQLPPYPTMFLSMGVFLVAVAAIYLWRSAPGNSKRDRHPYAREFDHSPD